MSYDYLSTIKPFALQVFDELHLPQRKWRHVKHFNVYRSLLRLLDNPDAIDQSCFGLCAEAAFLRSWAYRDPVAVAQFTTSLFLNGSANIGDFQVKPSDEMLYNNWPDRWQPVYPDFTDGKWGPGNPISESVWMIVCSLANCAESTIADIAGIVASDEDTTFWGDPASNLRTLCLPGDIKKWLEKTNCYTSVVDNTDVLDKFIVGRFNKTLANDSNLTSNYDANADIILSINSGMLYAANSITPNKSISPPQVATFPDHYVMLAQPVTQSGDILTVKLWTWGGFYEIKVNVNVFNECYYGSIVAHATTPRRSLNLTPLSNTAVVNQKIYFTQDHKLHFEWASADTRTEWFELHQNYPVQIPNPPSTGFMDQRVVLQRLLPASGPSGYHIDIDTINLPTPIDAEYQIFACHAALKPCNNDPFSYNGYDNVQCNVKAGYATGGPVSPLYETQTTHFRLRYYGFPGPKQIPDSLRSQADEAIQFAGEVAGHCYSDGRTEIMLDATTRSQVGNDAGTPFYVQKVAVWLEYFYHRLGQAPYSLQCANTGKVIPVTIGDGYTALVINGSPLLGINPPALEADLPAVCLKALLSLERAQTSKYPDWAIPPFVSQVAVAQIPVLTAPDGFCDYNSVYRPCEWMKAYDAQWGWAPAGRTVQLNTNTALNPQMPAVVFLKFDHGFIDDQSVTLILTGQAPGGGNPIGIPVPLTADPNHSYYYGSFQPANTWGANYTLKLEIQGARSFPNHILKTLIGEGIDADPHTIAYVNPSYPAILKIEYAEAGSDHCHQIQIGTQAQYARLDALGPDSLDAVQSNNSFATATPVLLSIPNVPYQAGASTSAQRSFDPLNLQNLSDVDYFDISFQCPTYDDSDAANLPYHAGTNTTWGIESVHKPPNLTCMLSGSNFHCLDLEVYKSDALSRALYRSLAKSTGCSIDSPSRCLGGKRCYFVVKNHNFASQGAFPYRVQFSYTTTYDSISVNTHAPGYTMGTVQRQFMEELYNHIDLPRPGDDREGIVHVEDLSGFIKGYEGFLIDPEVGALIERTFQRTGRTFAAEGLQFLGDIAQSYGQYTDSARIYRESANMFTAIGDRTRTIGTLDCLAGLYSRLGMTTELKAVRVEISRLQVIQR